MEEEQEKKVFALRLRSVCVLISIFVMARDDGVDWWLLLLWSAYYYYLYYNWSALLVVVDKSVSAGNLPEPKVQFHLLFLIYPVYDSGTRSVVNHFWRSTVSKRVVSMLPCGLELRQSKAGHSNNGEQIWLHKTLPSELLLLFSTDVTCYLQLVSGVIGTTTSYRQIGLDAKRVSTVGNASQRTWSWLTCELDSSAMILRAEDNFVRMFVRGEVGFKWPVKNMWSTVCSNYKIDYINAHLSAIWWREVWWNDLNLA